MGDSKWSWGLDFLMFRRADQRNDLIKMQFIWRPAPVRAQKLRSLDFIVIIPHQVVGILFQVLYKYSNHIKVKGSSSASAYTDFMNEQ